MLLDTSSNPVLINSIIFVQSTDKSGQAALVFASRLAPTTISKLTLMPTNSPFNQT
jgi:hypothetical protein